MRSNIQRLLEARVGAGKAIVEVNVDADMDSQTITERTVDPESQVAVSSETEEKTESAQGSNPSVTVASNLPDGDVGGDEEREQEQRDSSRERQNFEVSETRRERVILPGQVRKISVAVMVDGIIAARRRRQGRLGAAAAGGDGDAAPAGAVGDRLRCGARRHRDARVAAVHPAARAGLARRAQRRGLPRRQRRVAGAARRARRRSCSR